MPDRVAGVDVSYADADHAVGGLRGRGDGHRRELLWSTTVRHRVRFPYISGYLAYRELPILLELIAAARAAGELTDVVFVGRQWDPASAAGGDRHTVGGWRPTCRQSESARSYCAGSVDLQGVEPGRPQPVTQADDLLGMAVKAEVRFASDFHLARTAHPRRRCRADLRGGCFTDIGCRSRSTRPTR